MSAPLEQQHRTLDMVEQRLLFVGQMDSAVSRSLVMADRLRAAILRDAFSGALVPQDTHDEPATALLERIAADRASSSSNKPVGVSKPKAPRRSAGHQDRDERRMGIQLMWEDGYSMAEIAETMEMSSTQLGNEVARMRKQNWDLPYRRGKATA